MTTNILDSQKYTLTLVLKSAAGNLVAPTSIPVWDTSNASLVTITPSIDGLVAEVSATGSIGSAIITATVDGLTATDEVIVSSGIAVTAELIASSPVSK